MTKYQRDREYREAINDALIREFKFPVQLQGHCKGCGRGIPVGYLALVTKWEAVAWGKFNVMKPVELYCRKCGPSEEIIGEQRSRVHHTTVVTPVSELSAKDVAIKLLRKCTQGKARTARRLAKKAGIEFAPIVPMVLEKLAAANKLVKIEDDEGVKWRLP